MPENTVVLNNQVVELPENEELYCEMELRRKPRTTELYIKSPVVESIMKQLSSGRSEEALPVVGFPEGLRLYSMVTNIQNLPHINQSWWRESGMPAIYQNRINVAVLRSVGLSEGKLFTINMPFSIDMLNGMRNQFRDTIADLVANYTQEGVLRLIISGKQPTLRDRGSEEPR